MTSSPNPNPTSSNEQTAADPALSEFLDVLARLIAARHLQSVGADPRQSHLRQERL